MAGTIHDVAERAGCSIATVSRYVNGTAPLSLETRERIEAAIAAIGYRPSEIGRSLKRQATRTLGILVPSLTNPVFADSVTGFQTVARASGYTVLIATSEYDPEVEAQAVETFLGQSVDGLAMTVCDAMASPALAIVDASGKPVPHIAKSWSVSADGTEYTLALNDGVLCHDGSPLDANDVKYTVDRAFDAANPSVTQASWGPITAAEVVDRLTVKLKLKTPFVALVPFLADSFSSILCDSNQGKAGFGTSVAIGSGPWSLVSWTKGDRIVMARNPAYRNFGKLAENKGAPYMDGLVITTVPEPQARLAGLKTGAIHIAEPPLDDVPALKKSGDLKIVVAENTGQNVFWEFAVHRPPFNDKRARQAVAHATDAAAATDDDDVMTTFVK